MIRNASLRGAARRATFWVQYAVELLRGIPGCLVLWGGMPVFPRRTIHGIIVVDLLHQGDEHNRFCRCLDMALEMIKQQDLRRYNRICRQIRMVLRLRWYTAATYFKVRETCNIDTREVSLSDEDRSVVWLNRVLVHASTQGRLASLKIPYTNTARARFDRICSAEVVRFETRIGGGVKACPQ